MNVIELLARDHETVQELFDQFDNFKEEPEKNRNKLEKVFSKIKNELEMHTVAEEQFFYPELKDEEDTRDMVLKSLNDHQEIKSLLTELDQEQVNEQWIAKMSAMKENFQHHISDEENDLFEKAQEILDEDELEMIGESITQLKKAA